MKATAETRYRTASARIDELRKSLPEQEKEIAAKLAEGSSIEKDLARFTHDRALFDILNKALPGFSLQYTSEIESAKKKAEAARVKAERLEYQKLFDRARHARRASEGGYVLYKDGEGFILGEPGGALSVCTQESLTRLRQGGLFLAFGLGS